MIYKIAKKSRGGNRMKRPNKYPYTRSQDKLMEYFDLQDC
nr:MAG TPA: hypothetical protein [Caudoviricetes sp.]